jgi:hypothetical protein
VFWHLDVYPTRATAETTKGPRGTVIESLGKVWLFTIAEANWHPPAGVRIAKIGPLPVTPNVEYTAVYLEGVVRRYNYCRKRRLWFLLTLYTSLV